MSIKSDCANFLTTYCVQELPENELANVLATNECTSMGDRVLESNSRAAVRGLIHILLSSADAHLHTGIGWK